MAKLSQNQNGKENATNSSSSSNNNKNVNNNNNSSNGVTKAKRTRRSVPRDSPPQRSSIYRGVTRWTGRYEAHLWDKHCWNESQNKKGRQVYLGAYDDEAAAAHSYDLAALKYWGQDTIINFPLETYGKELKEMEGQSREEYIGSLRRKSSGFSRGVSKYRGVARHHHNGRWEARIGRVFGNKYLYLGTYATQEEAAAAYDMAAIEYRGLNAVTNFDLSRYIKWLKPNHNHKTTTTNNNNNNNTTLHLNNLNIPSSSNPNPSHELGLNFFSDHQQQQLAPPPTHQRCEAMLCQARPRTATSALGLLLQSSKFKEMMEMSSSVVESPSSPMPTPGLDHINHQRNNFPEEIQTYFQCNDSSSTYGEGEDGFFGDLNTYMPTMFQFDFDA